MLIIFKLISLPGKDDNEQLVQAFEKEKMVKKKVDQRLIELEFQSEEEKQGLQSKIDSLENIVKMLELKAKNSTDHCKLNHLDLSLNFLNYLQINGLMFILN